MQHSAERRSASDGNALLSHYLRDIRIPARVDPAEQVDLARRAQAGDGGARARLIEANLGLVIVIAREYRTARIALIDLIQEGNIGLMHAVEKFDPQRGIRFGTYAAWWIRQAVRRAVQIQGRLIYLPDRAAEQLQRLRRAASELAYEGGHSATAQELATASALSLQSVVQLLPYTTEPLSLDAPTHDGGALAAHEVIADAATLTAHEAPAPAALAAQVAELLTHLNPREQHIIELRFGLHDGNCRTQAETGKHLQISRERVRQLEVVALAKLRRAHQERSHQI